MQISLVIDIQDNDGASHDKTALEFSDEVCLKQGGQIDWNSSNLLKFDPKNLII